MFLVGSAFHLLSAAFGDVIRVVYRIERLDLHGCHWEA
jgi:hypothetical protein